MRHRSTSGDAFACLFRRVSCMRGLKQLQARLTKSGLAGRPFFVCKLVAFSVFSPWGSLDHAASIFLPAADADAARLPPFLYNAMIRAYSSSILPGESVRIYNLMCRNGVISDHLTYPLVLKACGRVPGTEDDGGAAAGSALPFSRKGAEIHCRVFRLGLQSDSFVQNSLLFMYSRCGRIDLAHYLFDEMPERTAVSWNTMVSAYNQSGDVESANQFLLQMPERDVSTWNGMITRHMRAGDVSSAYRVFHEMPERDAVSWNSMIAGHIQLKMHFRALELFKQMQGCGIEPTELTSVSVLGACAETGELELGTQIHMRLEDKGIQMEGLIGSALLDMYAKCGDLSNARKVFDEMGVKHATCWNSMIMGLAVHGRSEEAIELFAAMERGLGGARSAKPNRVTFLAVLTACSHKGLLKEGQAVFDRMVGVYGIQPEIKHYGCMVDLHGRCGLLGEAYLMVKRLPIRANAVLWKALLSACRVYGDVELAERAFNDLGEVGLLGNEEHILMSNIYAEAGRWKDAESLRSRGMGCAISKPPGFSKIEHM